MSALSDDDGQKPIAKFGHGGTTNPVLELADRNIHLYTRCCIVLKYVGGPKGLFGQNYEPGDLVRGAVP